MSTSLKKIAAASAMVIAANLLFTLVRPASASMFACPTPPPSCSSQSECTSPKCNLCFPNPFGPHCTYVSDE